MAFDGPIAALTIFCEADSATPEERRCISAVMFNRRKDGRFGKTIADVCLALKQFSEWNDDKADNANLRRGARVADNDPIMLDCIAAYEDIRSGKAFDLTHGATHYYDKSLAATPPYWVDGADCTLVTGKFFFYRNVK